jgi:phosphate transport system permease protein
MNSVTADAAITRWTGERMQTRLRRRYRSERLFKLLGLLSVGVSLVFLAFLLVTMIWRGAGGLTLDFLQASDSTDPAMAGVWGALKGSFLTIVVTMVLAFPVGVLSAIYLEEFASRNRWTDLIEVSINNLAAVPSIIFGLLGLALFLNFMHLPRSAPLVGGLTLALMTMPVIVIAGRNAIKSVPPSIREAALGVGASKMQVVFHHVLPLALPGILTGTIIGIARALGETAPLLMIGMRAFVATPPGGISDPATVLPVQIFLWSDEVDRSFVEKTSAAIIVLLLFMLLMNGLAIYLRNRFERRW